jgi:hypothetical protein
MPPKPAKKYKPNPKESKKSEPTEPGPIKSIFLTSVLNDNAISSTLFKNLYEASEILLNKITTECSKRIKAIQKSTSEALSFIIQLKKSIKSLYLSSQFSIKTLLDLKNFSEKASLYYRPLCEDFNIVVDKSTKEVETFFGLPDNGANDKKAEFIEAIKNHFHWAIVNNQGVCVLPAWIINQIEVGRVTGKFEIRILKRDKLVSIADIKNMKYYGVVKGNILPGQDLKKVSLS